MKAREGNESRPGCAVLLAEYGHRLPKSRNTQIVVCVATIPFNVVLTEFITI
jgi:hypothetical protein